MFLGKYECGYDNKGRIFVPAKLRENLSNVVVTCIDDDTLVVFKEEGWEPSKVFGDNITDREKIKVYEDYIYSNSYLCKIDKQGRIKIPDILRKRLNFSNTIVVSGKGEFFLLISMRRYLLDEKKRYEAQREISSMYSEKDLKLTK